jgi:photosystem II stability/assembly factor-like uncharacterized protein
MESRLLVLEGVRSGATRRAVLDHDLECLAVHPSRPERVLCGTFDAGLQRSVDGGRSWERVGPPSMAESVTALAASPADPDLVWAGTEPSAVYRSTDGGSSWERRPGLSALPSSSRWSFPPRPHTHHVRWLEPHPTDRDRLVVAIEAGALVRTSDGGETWLDHPDGARYDTHTIATHPSAPDHLRIAAGDGYAESLDWGETWRRPQRGLTYRYCWSVVVDPGDPDRVLCSAASGASAAHRRPGESYLYQRNGTERWTCLRETGLPVGDGALRAVIATDGTPGTVYALNNHGCYRSRDFGNSFERLDIEWPDVLRSETARGLAVV